LPKGKRKKTTQVQDPWLISLNTTHFGGRDGEDENSRPAHAKDQ
jgi:hypothetical protein